MKAFQNLLLALLARSDIAKEFLQTKDNPEDFQNFVNSWLAEPWEDTKLKTNADLVMERQTDLPAYVVPSWTKLLTAGVDVQETCLYWTIRLLRHHADRGPELTGRLVHKLDVFGHERAGNGLPRFLYDQDFAVLLDTHLL